VIQILASMYTILKFLLLATLFNLSWSVETIQHPCECGCEREAVLLGDIKVLELRHGEYTTSGRLPAIPQVECIGGSAKGYKEPTSIRCVNVGHTAPHWRCEAKLDNDVQLGQVMVTCEGYSAPFDPYVLRGSCGLKYTLEYKSWPLYILGYCSRLINLIILTPLKWLLYVSMIAAAFLYVLSLFRHSNKMKAKLENLKAEDGNEEMDEEYEEYDEDDEDEEDGESEELEEINEEENWKGRLRPRIPSPVVKSPMQGTGGR